VSQAIKKWAALHPEHQSYCDFVKICGLVHIMWDYVVERQHVNYSIFCTMLLLHSEPLLLPEERTR
jgi:hypothetical protein